MTGPLCAGHEDPEMWFTDDPAGQAAAKAVCAVCPARAACAALGADEPYGIYGGLTPAERAGGWLLLDAGSPEHPASRSCYTAGCTRPECREANRRYVAAWRGEARPVTPGGTVGCEQLALEVSA